MEWVRKHIIYVICILFTLTGCSSKVNKSTTTDCLEQIKDSGKLVVLTLYSSTSYFIYRGEEMGFQYELSKEFAASLGVKLQIKVDKSIPEMINDLQTGKGDLIAYNLPITLGMKDSVNFCGKEVVTHQVIVQRSIKNTKPLKNVTQLIGQEVYAITGKHVNRLKNLNEELGGGILIHGVSEDSLSTEDLITKVARKKIKYAVADNDVAMLNKTYYPFLNIDLAISFDQRSSWAVRKSCPKLAQKINEWFSEKESFSKYSAIMKRYFERSKYSPEAPILSLKYGKISHYDKLFKKYAPKIGWDWRLLASLAFKESNFDPSVVSWAGAEGLMQLMPSTAHAMGVPAGKGHDPESSVKAAVRYLGIMQQDFKMIKDSAQRTDFVLASYNAGMGHVLDAMALAEKYGKNKYLWKDNVEEFILLKDKQEYFNDPVCKYGYFRGSETYDFVRQIKMLYKGYRKKIK